MEKSILSILILIAFSLTTLQGTTQTVYCKSNDFQVKNALINNPLKFNQHGIKKDVLFASNTHNTSNLAISNLSTQSHILSKNYKINLKKNILAETSSQNFNSLIDINQNNQQMKTTYNHSEWYNKNMRNIYSSIWTYASLNYLYCDIAAFMDANMHSQYHTGTVDGFEMSPGFIAASAAMMQIALTNVLLPQVIKNDKTLRWVQIASGTLMTLVQSATLFSSKPASYYTVFSGFEIAATAYIAFDAIRWKPKRNTDNY